ncbi:MAG TPA: hypothetical protein ENN41_01485 [Sediminispirochaeta sp.]|nr:hypothetical protein [Sediminispirochaeta sp.]
MPGLGISELLLIALLILLFVRTEDLPNIMRFLGRTWAKAYRYYLLFKQEMRKMEKSMGIEEEMKDIRSISARLNSEIASFNKDLRSENKERDYAKEIEKQTEEIPNNSDTKE